MSFGATARPAAGAAGSRSPIAPPTLELAKHSRYGFVVTTPIRDRTRRSAMSDDGAEATAAHVGGVRADEPTGVLARRPRRTAGSGDDDACPVRQDLHARGRTVTGRCAVTATDHARRRDHRADAHGDRRSADSPPCLAHAVTGRRAKPAARAADRRSPTLFQVHDRRRRSRSVSAASNDPVLGTTALHVVAARASRAAAVRCSTAVTGNQPRARSGELSRPATSSSCASRSADRNTDADHLRRRQRDAAR